MSALYVADETKTDYAQDALVAAQVAEGQHSGVLNLGNCVHDHLVIDVVRMVEVFNQDRCACAESDRHKVVVVVPAHCEVELKGSAELVRFCENTVEGEQKLVADGESRIAVDKFSHGNDITEGPALGA